MSTSLRCVVVVAALLVALPSCGDDGAGREPPSARPVTVWVLGGPEAARPERAVGVAAPFREERVGFEVPGRVDFVIQVGREVEGTTLDDGGTLVREGEVVARLDATRYEQALRAAELRLDSAGRGLEAMRIDAATVAVSEARAAEARAASARNDVEAAEHDVRAAEAEEELARVSFDREKQLFDTGASTQAAFDRARRDLDGAVARLARARSALAAKRDVLAGQEAGVATAEAAVKLKEARVKQKQAEVAELEQALVRARQDLEDCVLHAPFWGRITAVHVARGAYVGPGEPVVTLTMMDPVKVSLTATAEASRRLVPGRQVAVAPKDLGAFTSEDKLYGTVHGKAEVADPATRTFRIDLVVRNIRRSLGTAGGVPEDAAVVEDV